MVIIAYGELGAIRSPIVTAVVVRRVRWRTEGTLGLEIETPSVGD